MQILKSLTGIVSMAGALALIASPALASVPTIPEPGTLSIFAVGVVGVIAVAMIKRKK